MIRAVAIDAAFANMGLAHIVIRQGNNLPSGARFLGPGGQGLSMDCVNLRLVQTEADKVNAKVVRKSSDDLRRAIELHRALNSYIEEWGAQVVFAEIPTGAQSAAAAKYLGAAIGILASVSIPIVEVSPMEVKVAVTGARKGGVTKPQVIAWAHKLWPRADWILHERNGKGWKIGDLQSCNEHLADALAIAKAGIATPAFQQLLALQHHATPGPDRQRPSSRRIPLL